jgi:hypothetical protein
MDVVAPSVISAVDGDEYVAGCTRPYQQAGGGSEVE